MELDGARACTLLPRPPYDFDYACSYFTRRAGELVDRAENGGYRRLFVVDGAPLLAELQPRADGRLALQVRAMVGAAAPSAAVCERVAATLRRTLGLDDDLAGFLAAVSRDSLLAGLARRFDGLRLISTPTPFEAFVWAVLGQQISLHVAFRLKAALVRRCGVHAAFDGTSYWAFPTPEALAAEDPDDLAALGLGRRKAATVVRVAGLAATGAMDFDELQELPLDEAERRLVALHGVGPWTARYTLLRGLRVADACPVSDGGLMAACGALYGLGRKASVTEVEAFAEGWRPYRGYAAFYLWFMLAQKGRGDG